MFPLIVFPLTIAVLIGLTIDWIYRLPGGLGSIVASVLGFATLVVAHNLSTTGDTMEMMRAVLDSNFWLATHVVTIAIGYSATFLAGFLAPPKPRKFSSFSRPMRPIRYCIAWNTGAACGFTATRSSGRKLWKYSAVMIDTIEALDA